MCGRFTLAKSAEEIEELLGEIEVDCDIPLAPRYNIAPSQPVLTVLNRETDALTFTQWGLVPPWAKDPSIGSRMINARAETVAEKPSFRGPFKSKRCLFLADGFYEWKKLEGRKTKQPVHIRLKSGKPFAFAGLWADWLGADGTELTTSTIITTTPNSLLADIHNRMPVILPPGAFADWLDPQFREADVLQPLLASYPSDEMEVTAVSRQVNNGAHDDPDCIRPLSEIEFLQPDLL